MIARVEALEPQRPPVIGPGPPVIGPGPPVIGPGPRAIYGPLVLVAACVLGAATWAALAPIRSESREELFAIPRGTWARRMAGDKVEILPSEIRLTLGLRDVLVLENRDDVPQAFGPTLMMPGQTFRLPFRQASRYQFACTAHLSGQLTVVVEPTPATPWARLLYRARALLQALG